MRTKLQKLSESVLTHHIDYDVIIFAETWLTDDIASTELGLPNYCIFRKDRCAATNRLSRGGGVLIAVKRGCSATELLPSVGNIEQVFVKVTMGDSVYVFGAVYLPPGSPPGSYVGHCNSIDELLVNAVDINFCVVGDFNLPRVTWHCDSSSALVPILQSDCVNDILSSSAMAECWNFHNVLQYNLVGNCDGRLLDWIFANFSVLNIANPGATILLVDTYHSALSFPVGATSRGPQARAAVKLDFFRADYGYIISALNGIDWDCALENLSIDESVCVLNSQFSYLIESYIPTYCTFKSSFPCWFSRELRQAIRNKKKAHGI